ncbi:hypothetical protein [Pseudomonas putida]|jgi:hypothetical protein
MKPGIHPDYRPVLFQVLLPSKKKPLSVQGKRLFQPIIAQRQAAQVS